MGIEEVWGNVKFVKFHDFDELPQQATLIATESEYILLPFCYDSASILPILLCYDSATILLNPIPGSDSRIRLS